MWIWIVSGIAAAAIAIVAAVMIASSRKHARILRDGKPVLCWIVFADDSLKQPMRSDAKADSARAQALFTLDEVPNHQKTLAGWTEKLSGYTAPENASDDEWFLDAVVRKHAPVRRPLRLPDQITGGAEAYTATIDVFWSKLPNGKLTLPYVYCKVLAGPGGGAVMIDYPKNAGKGKEEADALTYRQAMARLRQSPGSDDIVVMLNPLIWLLGGAEKQKGGALTREEALAVRDGAMCIVMPKAKARVFYSTLDAQAPVPRIDPERCWEEWQRVRPDIDRLMPR